MSFLSAFNTSVSGMTAQRQRVNTISENIANAETTRTPQGGPYRRREVILASWRMIELLKKNCSLKIVLSAPQLR